MADDRKIWFGRVRIVNKILHYVQRRMNPKLHIVPMKM